MWQRFTERARRIVFFAQEEAGRLGTGEVAPEHLLLGLLQEADCTAVRVLRALSVDTDVLRQNTLQQITPEPGRVIPDMQLSEAAKRVIDLAFVEAGERKSNYIGTEHLLLGVIREETAPAGTLLRGAGITLGIAREAVARLNERKPHTDESREESRRFSVETSMTHTSLLPGSLGLPTTRKTVPRLKSL